MTEGPDYKTSFQRLDNCRQLHCEHLGLKVWWTESDLRDFEVITTDTFKEYKLWDYDDDPEELDMRSVEDIEKSVHLVHPAHRRKAESAYRLINRDNDNTNNFFCEECDNESEIAQEDIDGRIPPDHYGLVTCPHCKHAQNWKNSTGKVVFQIKSRLPTTFDINGPLKERTILTVTEFFDEDAERQYSYLYFHHRSRVSWLIYCTRNGVRGAQMSREKLMTENPFADIMGEQENGDEPLGPVLLHLCNWPIVYAAAGYRKFPAQGDVRNLMTNDSVEKYHAGMKHTKQEGLITYAAKSLKGAHLTYLRVKQHCKSPGHQPRNRRNTKKSNSDINGNGDRECEIDRGNNGQDNYNKTPQRDERLETLWNAWKMKMEDRMTGEQIIEDLAKRHQLNTRVITSYRVKYLWDCIKNKYRNPSANRAYIGALWNALNPIKARVSTKGGKPTTIVLKENTRGMINAHRGKSKRTRGKKSKK